MSDNILHKYTGRLAPPADGGPEVSDADGTEDLGSFGWCRGARDTCRMLELRKRTGNVMAIPYAYISAVLFDASEGITIKCGEMSIVIKGRNLNTEARPQVRLFQGLTRHRVPWVQEAERSGSVQVNRTSVQIDSIEW